MTLVSSQFHGKELYFGAVFFLYPGLEPPEFLLFSFELFFSIVYGSSFVLDFHFNDFLFRFN